MYDAARLALELQIRVRCEQLCCVLHHLQLVAKREAQQERCAFFGAGKARDAR